ncbi:MAG: cation transporter [Moraxellaceae bacterium]|nr:cation transporter [Moraxellaceae bacterium]
MSLHHHSHDCNASHHTHHHSHAPTNYGHIFAIGISLNIAFVIIEAILGWQAQSLALMADAGHNLSDVLALLLAWSALWLGQKKGNDYQTYGWRRASLLAALINAILLLVAMGAMAWEAMSRLHQPNQINGMMMIWVASIGVVINGVTAWLFMKDSQHDINIKGAFLHMAADALVSLGVIITGLLYVFYGWAWLDPVMSLLIAGVIIIGTWGLFKQSLHLSLDGVPESVNLNKVRVYLLSQPLVIAIHDLHIWALSSTETALTVQIIMESLPSDDVFLQSLNHDLEDNFGINHATIQIMRHPLNKACY